MKKAKRPKFLALAICLAAMMHLWLFTGFRPANGDSLKGVPVPPETYYSARLSDPSLIEGENIRAVWSPVLFSLPSEIGFSRDLLQEKLYTRLTFQQPDEPESFLAVDSAPRNRGAQVLPGELMVTTRGPALLPPPSMAEPEEATHPPVRRVFIDPDLRARLVGGIVLPPELNQAGDTGWEVHADISISEQGSVRHVFLEQPLEAGPKNMAVIRMLRGLRFKPGSDPVEGRIEIYSPVAVFEEGAKP